MSSERDPVLRHPDGTPTFVWVFIIEGVLRMENPVNHAMAEGAI